MFRRVGILPIASELIRSAVSALQADEAREALKLHNAGRVDMLLTGVGSQQTMARRSRQNKPGHCYRMAGWEEFNKSTRRADTWLILPWRNPWQDGGDYERQTHLGFNIGGK